METNLVILEKKAIDAALKNDWVKALELNEQILKKNSSDLNAQIRLGKAQIQTKDFQKAIKTFKKVLEVDPINQIATKNLAVAKEGKPTKTAIQPKKLIKEPGTTTETQIMTTKKSGLDVGLSLKLNVKKNSVDVILADKIIGTIEDKDVIKSLNKAKQEKISFEVSVIKQKENKVRLLISAQSPIFKAEKQDIKPYFKKGTIEEEEPELEYSMEVVEEE